LEELLKKNSPSLEQMYNALSNNTNTTFDKNITKERKSGIFLPVSVSSSYSASSPNPAVIPPIPPSSSNVNALSSYSNVNILSSSFTSMSNVQLASSPIGKTPWFNSAFKFIQFAGLMHNYSTRFSFFFFLLLLFNLCFIK
jgi:hypothetical protein